jgi:hypothetical protein
LILCEKEILIDFVCALPYDIKVSNKDVEHDPR